MDESQTSQISNDLSLLGINEVAIPPSLKFLMTTIKSTVHTQLTHENYSTWRSQVLKLLRANDYESFIDGSTSCPTKTLTASDGSASPNPLYRLWKQVDQNLASALCSTISASLLPYVINLDTAHEIWCTIERQLQASNRSKVIQLKNELHNVQMKTQSMTQYLAQIKCIVDSIAAAGANVDNEDIILYTLRGLPATYLSFKTSIRTQLAPISLDVFYALLCSEEIHHSTETETPHAPTVALQTQRGRGRGFPYRGRGRWNTNRRAESAVTYQRGSLPQCQICSKIGHSALQCWHRLNPNFSPSASSPAPTALAASPQAAAPWILDSGATSHLTNNLDYVYHPQPYTGNEHITVGNGSVAPIQHSGHGILPTPSGKLQLSQLLHSPSISHNLISISKLIADNKCSILFDSSGFSVKDNRTQQLLLKGPCRHGLYPTPNLNDRTSSLQALSAITSAALWHRRLGHPHSHTLSVLSRMYPHLQISSRKSFCNSCSAAKCHRLPFAPSCNHNYQPLELIHSDVWGPSPL